MNSLKQELFNLCQDFVDSRLKAILKTIEEIQTSLNSETKSSAGDKHETGRAMLQLDREKAGQQLAEIQKLNQILSKIKHTEAKTSVALGSLVCTTNINYFIAISAGELKVDNNKYYAISANTPIGQRLLGKQVGNQISFRDQEFEITAIN